MNDKSTAVPRAPEREVPGGAMPQAAEQHRDKQIAIRSDFAPMVSAQADIKVVTQPRREADMPAPPELADIPREVRQIKIEHDIKAENTRRASGNIRVAG